jgi:hypothetical protein
MTLGLPPIGGFCDGMFLFLALYDVLHSQSNKAHPERAILRGTSFS